MRKPATKSIRIVDLRRHYEGLDTQLRLEVDREVVADYAEAMRRGDKFPPVDVVAHEDGSTFYLCDGWHRVEAVALLRQEDGRKSATVAAKVHPVPSGMAALEHAKELALEANIRHGLQLNKGDQKRRAEAAWRLHPKASLGELERRFGISRSTLSRARQKLIVEGVLPEWHTGEPLPSFVPEQYAHAFRGGTSGHPLCWDLELREAVFDFVGQLKPFDSRNWTFEPPEGASDDDGAESEHGVDHWRGIVSHYGLVTDRVVEFSPFPPNSVKDGLPRRRKVKDLDRKFSDEELARWEAARRTREVGQAWARLERHLRPAEVKLLRGLVKRAGQQQDLAEDLRRVFPAQSSWSDFMPDPCGKSLAEPEEELEAELEERQ